MSASELDARAWTLYQVSAMLLIKYGTMDQSHGRKLRIFQTRERGGEKTGGGFDSAKPLVYFESIARHEDARANSAHIGDSKLFDS